MALCATQVVLSAAGKNFCAGLDLSYMQQTFLAGVGGASGSGAGCPARARDRMLQVRLLQVLI